ncbi:MAG: cupin domain-containing protein [Selenomonadaceae bacterium]|nr:cupin domain-containing protein [Selenomonadaceae bacterium]
MPVMESKTVTAKNKSGGKGEIYITHLLQSNFPTENCQMFASVTIPVGASIGYHKHNGNSETYHILNGKALYTDNGKIYEVKVGDTTFCADGDSHGIENIGDDDLKFIALIIKS